VALGGAPRLTCYRRAMKQRSLGRSGLLVSGIGFGAWALGGNAWGGARDDDSRAALRRARERGITLIDTALEYGDGHSEELVGEVLREGWPGAVVATKVPPKAMQWPAPRGAALEDFFPAGWIRSSCERSLRNLRVERIDLLQLHVWADAWTERDEWYEELAALRKEGKVRLLGASINSHDPASAVRLARSGRVDVLQVQYNAFDQSPEDELFGACLEHGVGVLARVPFDESALTGKLTLDTRFPAGDFRADYFGGPLLAETVRRVEALRPLLEGAAGSMARGALRYCLSHPAVSSVIPGMRSPAQVDDNVAGAEGGALPEDVLREVRAKHRWVREAY
jgi:aryl-alcohol dehydrogenase-like predicted oxidoreductase